MTTRTNIKKGKYKMKVDMELYHWYSKILRCPSCHGELDLTVDNIVCSTCEHNFHKNDGFWDFTGPGIRFKDAWSLDPGSAQSFLSQHAIVEEQGQKHFAEYYINPLLKSLFPSAGSVKVLSIGCGCGMDVDVLNMLGFEAWGVEPGQRPVRWINREKKDRLFLADGKRLPFADDSFDFIYSEGVIEHVGVIGDSGKVQADYKEQRRTFLEEAKRVTRPGGYLLITSPNRLCPVDICHGGPHLHSVFHPFYVSYGDVLELLGEDMEHARQLSLRNFFNLSGRHFDVGNIRVPGKIIELFLRVMNSPVLWRLTTPMLSILAKKPEDMKSERP